LIDIDRKIYNEQIRLIHNQGTIPIVGSTVCALVITLFLWSHMPQVTLIFWFGAVSLVASFRLWGIYTYLRADQKTRERTFWGPIFWLGSLAGGIIWGAWPLIFYSAYSAENLLLISTIFAGMITISAANGGNYLPSFLSFSVPLVLPLAVAHLLSDKDSLALVGYLLLMFLVVNFMLEVRSNRQNRELISSQMENQILVESLAEEKQIAERAMIAKSRFLAAASHDLRQPLHAMGLFLVALRNKEKDPEKMRIIEDMSKSSEALNSLFNSLLDVSRLDAEIIEFNPEHVPASRLFDALRAQFEHQTSEKNITLCISAEDHVIFSDVVLLERVLRNLLSNAVQYTCSGSISLHCVDGDNGSKLITLTDTGMGIPAESVEDVFSEYYQLNNPARDRKKGLGLGLAIVRRLCELMDLPLEMESVEGRGTVFRVIVPGGDESEMVLQTPPLRGMEATGRRVLVIDDEPQVLQSMRYMLEGWGCEVLLAGSARDALRVLALSDIVPDIIISDYRLADNLNGVDAVAAIRESVNIPIKAIVVTGDTSPERLKQVKGADLQLLHKPVSPEELQNLVDKLFKESDIANESLLPGFKSAANQ